MKLRLYVKGFNGFQKSRLHRFIVFGKYKMTLIKLLKPLNCYLKFSVNQQSKDESNPSNIFSHFVKHFFDSTSQCPTITTPTLSQHLIQLVIKPTKFILAQTSSSKCLSQCPPENKLHTSSLRWHYPIVITKVTLPHVYCFIMSNCNHITHFVFLF